MTSTQRSSADDKAADAEYITAVRGGDTSAYEPLYKRHQAAAYHLARQMVTSPSEAEDLVSEAFAKVFNTLLAGGGPDSAFRAYLLTSVRNTFYDSVRAGKKLHYTDNLEMHDDGEPFEDPAVKGLDNELAAKAFSTLPERWQTVLWHTEIEGESPAQVAPLLGLTANGAAALAYRAREGLKQAFLQAHVAVAPDDACKVTSERLGAWSRGGLSKREQTQVDRHLEQCDRCAAVAAEISDLGAGLRGVVAVAAIGTPTLTAAYLAGGSMAKIGALAWVGAAAPAAGFAKINALVTGIGTTAAVKTTTAATTAAGVFVESSSSSAAAAAGGAAHSSRGLWGAVAGTAAVAAIATVVIVSANFGDPEPSAEDVGVVPSTSASSSPSQAPSSQQPPAPSSAPRPSAAPLPSGGTSPGTSLDDLEDLPSIPAVDEDLLTALPSIAALPSETTAPEAPAEEPPADEAPAPSSPPPPPTTSVPGPTTSEAPAPSSPPPPPTEEDPSVEPAPINTTLLVNQYISEDVAVKNFGQAAYESMSLSIPTFGTFDDTLDPTGGTTCTVVVVDSALSSQSLDCGDIAATFALPADLVNSGGITIRIEINVGTDVVITGAQPAATTEAVVLTFSGLIGTNSLATSAILNLPVPAAPVSTTSAASTTTSETTTASTTTGGAP